MTSLIFSCFYSELFEESAPGGGVLARFYRPGGWGLNSFFTRGVGIRPSKKLPGGDGQAWKRLIHKWYWQ